MDGALIHVKCLGGGGGALVAAVSGRKKSRTPRRPGEVSLSSLALALASHQGHAAVLWLIKGAGAPFFFV